MKFKSKTNKKLLVSFGLLSCVGLVTLPIISCSKNNVVSLNEQQINEQFSKFYIRFCQKYKKIDWRKFFFALLCLNNV